MSDPFFGDATNYETDLPTLRGERLTIRPLTEADDAAIVKLFSDERSLETWFRPPYTSIQQAQEYRGTLQTGFERRTLFVWGIFASADGSGEGPLAGVGILTRWSALHRRIDLGYYLASDHWGRGYATEAVGVMLRFAYDSLGVHRVEAEVVPGNDASVRVLERAGFRHEATLVDRLWGEDAPQQSMLFRLLRFEFDRATTADS